MTYILGAGGGVLVPRSRVDGVVLGQLASQVESNMPGSGNTKKRTYNLSTRHLAQDGLVHRDEAQRVALGLGSAARVNDGYPSASVKKEIQEIYPQTASGVIGTLSHCSWSNPSSGREEERRIQGRLWARLRHQRRQRAAEHQS